MTPPATLMLAADAWGARWRGCDSEIARKYMCVASEKKSLVCLAADRPTIQGLNELIEQVGDYIAALKTHVDLVEDWTKASWKEFIQKANDANVLVFEDRKFADIGKITKFQMGGIYDIKSWADLVTAHLISGPDIVDGVQNAWADSGRGGGVLLLAQMSSRGNLLDEKYSNLVISVGKEKEGVFGFIGNGSNPSELKMLRDLVGEQKMIWTPGVNINVGEGDLGQRYGCPRQAVLSGSDAIIVGSGIHSASNPKIEAEKYAQISWNALLEREGIQ